MARIAGVDLPKNERIEIGLTRIFGIGRSVSQKILSETNINPNTRVKDLTNEEIVKIRGVLERDYRVEGDLRRDIAMNVKRLIDIGSYRGQRHRLGLPLRGRERKRMREPARVRGKQSWAKRKRRNEWLREKKGRRKKRRTLHLEQHTFRRLLTTQSLP